MQMRDNMKREYRFEMRPEQRRQSGNYESIGSLIKYEANIYRC